MDNSIGVNLPIPMDPMGMNPHHPYNSILNKANLRFEGNIEEMVLNWTDEERQARRRLVQFWRRHENNNIFCTFKPVNPSERPPNSIVVSCIYWQEKMDCFITSVDCIYLLESLISVRFTVEEKNRIRRNLEGFRPLTVSKCKPESAEFFKLIMSFPNPKPRNIEKDVKVFPWKVLPYALKKIVGKYTASYTSAIGMDPFQSSMSPSASQFPLMTGLQSHYGYNGNSLNPAFAGRNAQRRFSQPATSLSMSMYNRVPKSEANYSMDLSHPLAGQLSSNSVSFEQGQNFNFNSNSGGGDNQSDSNSNYSTQISNPFTNPGESGNIMSQMEPISEVSGMENMGMSSVFDQSQGQTMNLVNRRAAMFQRRHSLADPYSMHRYEHRRISSGGDTTGMDQIGGLMGQNNYPFGNIQQMPIGSLNQGSFENKEHYEGHESGANSAGHSDANPTFGHSKDMGYYAQSLMNKGSAYGQSVEAPIKEE